jgi:hypothetical protein
MKENNMGRLLKTLALSLLVVACGKSADPLNGYSIKTEPAHNKPQPTQTLEVRYFTTEVIGTAGQNVANFVDGTPGSITIKVRPVDPAITDYDLKVIQQPEGSNIKRIDPITWEFYWHPKGVIRPDDQQALFFLKLEAQVHGSSDERYRISQLLDTISLNVLRTISKPSVQKENLPKDFVTPNEAMPFSMDVRDPGAFGTTPPTAEILPSGKPGSEGHKIDSSKYVTMTDPPIRQQDGNWRFHFLFDPRGKKIPSVNKKGLQDPTVEEVDTCFATRYHSPSKFSSAERRTCIRIVFTPVKPELKWDDSKNVVKVGQLSNLVFTVSAPSAKGILIVENTTPGFESLPGAPKWICSSVAAAQKTLSCKVSWNIPCDSAFSDSYPITFKASHRVSQLSEASEFSKLVKVTKSEAACKPKVTPKPVTPAPAGGTK